MPPIVPDLLSDRHAFALTYLDGGTGSLLVQATIAGGLVDEARRRHERDVRPDRAHAAALPAACGLIEAASPG